MKYNIPLSVPCLSHDILPKIERCIDSGWVSSGGEFIEEFEKNISEYLKVKRAIGVQSGTAAIHLALMALDISLGDEVLCPTVSFIATVNPILYVGATPVFFDCDETLNVDVEKIEEFLVNECVEENGNLINKTSKKTVKAIILVHVFGNPMCMEKIIELAKRYSLKIIEDAAEALGSYYTKGAFAGRFAGTIGDIGIFSFNANKIMTTGGGGMVVANNETYLERVKFMSEQSKTDRIYFKHDEIGYNYRLTNISAAFGCSQLEKIESFISNKKKNYELYKKLIVEIPGIELLPFNEFARPNYWFYTFKVNELEANVSRDEILNKLISIGIQVRPLWYLLHKQKFLKTFQAYKVKKAKIFAEEILNLPCSSSLSSQDVETVVNEVKKIVQK